MSSLNYCRLCVNIGLDFKSLYDEHGNANEVYELTTKYFDKSILNINEAQHLPMICLQCWEHIWDFNNFQQAVHVAQSNLNAYKQLEISTQIEKAKENLTQDICLNNSAAEGNKNYTNLIETGEVEIEIISDEDVDTNDQAKEIIHQSKCNVIYVDSDSNLSSDEHSKTNNPETLSVCESGVNTLNQECSGVNDGHNYCNNSSISGQSPSNSNNIENGFNEELTIYTPKSKQSFVCAICSKICCQYHSLRDHFKRMHPSENIHTLCCNLHHIGFRAITLHLFFHYFKCMLCGSKCRKLDVLLRHISKTHPDDGGKEYEKRLQQWSSTGFLCNECETIYPNFHSFSRHILILHSKREHKCEICNKYFKAPSVVREHMTTHTGERIHTCPQCPQKFRKRSALWCHKKKKHGNGTS